MRPVSFWKFLLCFLLPLFALFGTNASATPTSIPWTGPTDFDSALIGFPSFTASQVSISTLDRAGHGGYAHSHVGDMTFSIKILLDGSWTTIYSQTLGAGNQQYLADLPTISFNLGVVSGLWLESNPFQGDSFHGFEGCMDPACMTTPASTDFNFSVAQAVPEPASAALIGLGLLGVALQRRRRS